MFDATRLRFRAVVAAAVATAAAAVVEVVEEEDAAASLEASVARLYEHTTRAVVSTRAAGGCEGEARRCASIRGQYPESGYLISEVSVSVAAFPPAEPALVSTSPCGDSVCLQPAHAP